MRRLTQLSLFVLTLFSLSISSCNLNKKPKIKEDFEVVLRIPSEPSGLNSIVNRDGMKGLVLQYIMYQPLFIDFETLEISPLIAKKLPEIETHADGQVKVTMHLRPEAKWDNGQHVTSKDVAFSLKLCVLPGIQNAAIKPGFQDVIDFITYPDDSLKYSIVFSKPYFLAPIIAGDMNLYPEYVYDSLGLLRKYSISDIQTNLPALLEDKEIAAYAELFNSDLYSHKIVQGCGPYAFKEWQSGKRIVLERKKDWWGDEMNVDNCMFKAYPTRIVFEVIQEESTAIQALKQGKVDGMASIDYKTFALTLKNDSVITKNFDFFSPDMLAFEYLGLNSKRAKLHDTLTRKALAYGVSSDEIISTLMYGLANKVNTYISKVRIDEKNNLIPYNTFDISKGNEMLTQAGWIDGDGNGIREKVIDGKKTPLVLSLLINAGNERREKTALMLKENFGEMGVSIEIKTLEMGAYIETLMKNDFDIVLSGTLASAIETDPFQLWHTASKGGNFTGFGDAYSDSLIMRFRSEMNPAERIEISKKLQKRVSEYGSVIFLNDMKERIVFSKKFVGLTVSQQRPALWLGTVLPK